MIKIIHKEYTLRPYCMICASAEAEAKVYKRIDDSRGNVWLVPLNDPNAGGGVHFDNPRDTKSDGYAGRTISFQLEDGSVYEAKGPWHSNCDALFAATGHDVRDKHMTRVVVALDRACNPDRMIDVVYCEEEPRQGTFGRHKAIGQEWADKIGHPIFVYSESHGGSSNSPVIPSSWTNKQANEYWQNKRADQEC